MSNNTNANTNSRLYKLKYFCQICNKQMQDKDGFNCHLNSNYHRQNMEIISDNPNYYISNYSKEFESGYMDILRRNYPRQWVCVNKIYQEYISDKFATHMNATKWSTLTGFIKYLENTGKVLVQEDEKAVKIKYIDNTPQGISEKNKVEKKKKDELLLEKINEKKIQEKIIKDKLFEEEKRKKIEAHNLPTQPVSQGSTGPKTLNECVHPYTNINKPIEIDFAIDKNKLSTKSQNKLLINQIKASKLGFKLDEREEYIINSGKDEKANEMKNYYSDNLFNKIGKSDYYKAIDHKNKNKLNQSYSQNNNNDNKSKSITIELNPAQKNEEKILLNKKTSRDKEMPKRLENSNDDYEEITQVKSVNKNPNSSGFSPDQCDVSSNHEDSEEMEVKDYFDKEEPWINKNLIVRIKDANLSNGDYYDLKAVILRVFDSYLAELKILDLQTVLRIDQEFLQPVLPKVNSAIEILYGIYKGKIGILKEINEYNKTALVDISEDSFDNIVNIDLSGICKVNIDPESQGFL